MGSIKGAQVCDLKGMFAASTVIQVTTADGSRRPNAVIDE